MEAGHYAQRVRDLRCNTSAPSCNGPGRCGTSGLRAPARCSTVPQDKCSKPGKPSHANRGPKNRGRSRHLVPRRRIIGSYNAPAPRVCVGVVAMVINR